MKAVKLYRYGNPDELIYEEIEKPQIKNGEVLVKVSRAGINFSDIYQRKGVNPLPSLPYILGQEGAGIVVESLSSEFKTGDRVAWLASNGAYAEYVSIPVDKLIHIPENISDEIAASGLLQGITAHYLAYSTYKVNSETVALVHAGAGGVGALLVQLLKKQGATVITTVSSNGKVVLAQSTGADFVIDTSNQNFVEVCREVTQGQGVDVVYDSIGLVTYEGSLSVVKPLGLLVLFGQSSGKVPPIDPIALSKQGSIYLTRPTLATYTATREELQKRAHEVFKLIEENILKININKVYSLDQASLAHQDLESRKTTGKLLLAP